MCGLTGAAVRAERHEDSIARGEQLSNKKPITITGVASLNDRPGGLETVKGFCATCHVSATTA
jgi:hypothetical protein